MPLPSQSSRAGLGGPGRSGRGSVYRGGRRRRRRGGGVPLPLKAGGGVVVLVLAVWAVWSLVSGDGPTEATAADPAIVDPLTSEGDAASPMVIDQGSSGARAARGSGAGLVGAPAETPTGVRSGSGAGLGAGSGAGSGATMRGEGGGLLGGAIRGGEASDRLRGAPGVGDAGGRGGVARPAAANAEVGAAIAAARTRLAENDPLGAREDLNLALHLVGRDGPGAGALRAELMTLNDDLVFGPRAVDGDGLSRMYVVQAGDALSRIANRLGNGTHWKLIQRVNRLSSPNTIRVGQSLKVVTGPFHAVVDRSDYRLDVYHGEPSSPGSWMYVTSLPVGLGEDGSTPSGRFVVRSSGKLENPAWVNPRNPSERYDGDDPENPIGEFWVGIEGLGDDAVHTGLGLHGTIEPETIGTQSSMGCVRLGAEDVALVYELLSEGESLVTIVD